MDLGSAGLTQHAHQGTLGVAAHDRVVDDHEALALDDLAHGVELESDAELAQGLSGLDEGPSHVGVLDQALPVVDAGGLGVTDGRRGPGLRGGDDQVRLHRVLAGQGRAHGVTGGDDRAAGDLRVRAGEVDVLEDAARTVGDGEAAGAHAVGVDLQELAGLDLTDHRGAHDVQGRGLRGHDPAALQAAQNQGTHAVGVASGIEGVLVHEDQGEGTAQHRQDAARGLGDAERGLGRLGGGLGDAVGVEAGGF